MALVASVSEDVKPPSSVLVSCGFCLRSEIDLRCGRILNVDDFQFSQLSRNIVAPIEPTMRLCPKCCQELALVGQLLYKWKDKIVLALEYATEPLVVKKEENMEEFCDESETKTATNDIPRRKTAEWTKLKENQKPDNCKNPTPLKDDDALSEVDDIVLFSDDDDEELDADELRTLLHGTGSEDAREVLDDDDDGGSNGDRESDEDEPDSFGSKDDELDKKVDTKSLRKRAKERGGDADKRAGSGSDFEEEEEGSEDEDNDSDYESVETKRRKRRSAKSRKKCVDVWKTRNSKSEAKLLAEIQERLKQSKDVEDVDPGARLDKLANLKQIKKRGRPPMENPKRRRPSRARKNPKLPPEKRVGEWICDECGKTFKFLTYFERHIADHSATFNCLECGKTLPDRGKLKEHMKRHEWKGKINCDLCEKIFNSPDQLRRHKLVHHGGEKTRLCRFCPAKFWDGQGLKDHERIHTGEKPYPCNHCDKIFRTAFLKRQHMRQKHDSARERKFVCRLCGQGFYDKWSRYEHETVKHAPPKVPCPHNCGRIFRWKHKAKEHGKKCPTRPEELAEETSEKSFLPEYF